MKNIIIILFAILLSGIPARAADAVRKSVEITIYNDGLGVVKEKREVNLEKGECDIVLKDIPCDIIPGSIILDFDGEIIEQTYAMNRESYEIYKDAIGKMFKISNDSLEFRGKLIYYDNFTAIIQDSANSLHLFDGYYHMELIEKSDIDFIKSKTPLKIKVNANKSGKQIFYITYQFQDYYGIKCKLKYTAELSEDKNSMDFLSNLIILNSSGVDYTNAKIKLVKGEYFDIRACYFWGMEYREAYELPKSIPLNERNLFDYSIFELDGLYTLKNDTTTVINIFNKRDVKVKPIYFLDAGSLNKDTSIKTSLIFSITNIESNQLGFLLSKGTITFIETDKRFRRYLGSGTLEYTPAGDTETVYAYVSSNIYAKLISKKIRTDSNSYEIYEKEILVTNPFKDKEININIQEYASINSEVLEANTYYKRIICSSDSFDSLNFYTTISPNTSKVIKYKVKEARDEN